MPARSRFRTGMALGRASWRMLLDDRQLLWLPASAAALSLLTAALLGGGGLVLAARSRPAAYAVFVVLLLALSWISTFFSAAVVSAGLTRLQGGEVTVRGALGAAWARRGPITRWALVAGLLGVVLRFVEERFGAAGAIVGAIVGAAWAVATLFAVPVVLVTGSSPLAAARQSVQLVRARWGETAGAAARVGVYLIVPILACVLAGAALAMVNPLAGVTVGIALLLPVLLLSAALQALASAVLYRYATTGATPSGLDPAVLQAAVTPRRRRTG